MNPMTCASFMTYASVKALATVLSSMYGSISSTCISIGLATVLSSMYGSISSTCISIGLSK